MSRGRKILWAAGVIFVLLSLVATTIPNLLRSRMSANEYNLTSMLLSAQARELEAEGQLGLDPAIAAPEKKLVYNAELGLVVADVRTAAQQIQKLTEADHGEIDRVEITDRSSGQPSATLLVRVPASGFRRAIGEFKKIALRAESEQLSTRDVTREFYDNEAHMRNLHAEEEQYFTILKQARTVKDTLEASEKLSGVRDRIERHQIQIQLMTHDIEMSAVTIALQEFSAPLSSVHWHPMQDMKTAAWELVAGLGKWFDWVLATIIKLPLIVLWVMTAATILWVCWQIGRYVWVRLRNSNAVKPNGQSSPVRK